MPIDALCILVQVHPILLPAPSYYVICGKHTPKMKMNGFMKQSVSNNYSSIYTDFWNISYDMFKGGCD